MPDIDQTTARRVLDLPMDANDSGADTVRGYLVALLAELWRVGECFSGKRPFGNSGWEYDLYLPLINVGLVPGRLDEDGYIEYVDSQAASALIEAAIREMGVAPEAAASERGEAISRKLDAHAGAIAAKLRKSGRYGDEAREVVIDVLAATRRVLRGEF